MIGIAGPCLWLAFAAGWASAGGARSSSSHRRLCVDDIDRLKAALENAEEDYPELASAPLITAGLELLNSCDDLVSHPGLLNFLPEGENGCTMLESKDIANMFCPVTCGAPCAEAAAPKRSATCQSSNVAPSPAPNASPSIPFCWNTQTVKQQMSKEWIIAHSPASKEAVDRGDYDDVLSLFTGEVSDPTNPSLCACRDFPELSKFSECYVLCHARYAKAQSNSRKWQRTSLEGITILDVIFRWRYNTTRTSR